MTARLYNLGGNPRLLAAGALALAVFLRLALILTHDGYLGVDGGAYLLSVNTVLGDEPTNVDFTRPPLAPGWLLVPFLNIWGLEWGYKIFSFSFSILPLLPAVYLLARSVLTPWQSAVVIAFYSFDLLTGEMYVSGVLPLIGMGLFALLLWGIPHPSGHYHRERLWRTHRIGFQSRWHGMAVIAALALIPFVNHTSAGKVAIDLPIFLAVLAFFSYRAFRWPSFKAFFWPWFMRLAPVMAVGAGAGLLALPWYWGVAPGSEFTHFPGPWVYFAHYTDAAWIQFALFSPAGIWVMRAAPDPKLKALGAITLVESVLLVFLSNDETVINIFYRARYFVMPFAIICWAWIISTYAGPYLLRNYKRVSLTSLAAVWGLSVWGFAFQFDNQTYYSDFMTPDMLETAESLPEGRDHGVITNGFMFATWIAATEKVPVVWTYTTAPPRRFTEQYEHTKCVMGWRTGCDPVESARIIGMTHIMIDTKFPYVSHRSNNYAGAPVAPWLPLENAPWVDLLDANGTTRLYKIHEGAN